jgi:hypothetical protein
MRSANPDEIKTSELVSNIGYWREVAGTEKVDSILWTKATSGELSSFLTTEQFRADWDSLYALALKGKDGKGYRKFLVTSLTNFAQKDWSNAMLSESGMIGLAISMRSDGLALGLPFQDALYSHVEQRIAKASPAAPRIPWGEVVGLLDRTQAGVFKQRLLSRFKNPTGRIGGLIPFYGELLASAALEDGPENSYERIKQIIETHDPTELLWLATVMKVWKSQSDKANGMRKDWKERAEKALKQDLPAAQVDPLKSLLSTLVNQPST